MARPCATCNGVGFVDLDAEPKGCPSCNPDGQGAYLPPPREEPKKTLTWVDGGPGRSTVDSTPEREDHVLNPANQGHSRPS
jgi:hypothetical protein